MLHIAGVVLRYLISQYYVGEDMGIKLCNVKFEFPDRDEYGTATISRRCRYFNILWFKTNNMFAKKLMAFGQSVTEKIDKSRFRMTVLKHPKKYEFRFWALDDEGKIDKTYFGIDRPFKPIYISKKGYVLNIKKAACIKNEYLYATALQLKVLETPKRWKTIRQLDTVDWATATWKYNTDNNIEVIEVWDRLHNHVKVPLRMITNHLHHFALEYNRIKNLKQFHKIDTERKRWSFHRAVIRAIKRSKKKHIPLS